jgi:hypothetical protein
VRVSGEISQMGVWMPQKGGDDHVIDFKPETGFTIEKLAKQIVDMMRDLDMDARITLPDAVIEIEKECTAKEIIDGYKEFIATKIRGRTSANKNEKEPEPVK